MALAFLFYVPFYPFQTWYVHTVSTALGGKEWASLIAEATVMLINGVLEFCWQKFVIYRKSANTAEHKETAPDAATDAAPEIEHIKDSGVSVEDVTLGDNDTITKG